MAARKPTVGRASPAANPTRRLHVKVARLAHAEGLALPAYHSAGAAGLDLVAAVPEATPLRLAPLARALVPTGLSLELPAGVEAQVRPRSGLALKHGITVLNSPGTIDSDYRGEVQVLLVNLGDEAFEIARGERIAQLVFARVEQASLEVTVKLAESVRGAGGFGSTGTAATVIPAEGRASKKGKLFQSEAVLAKARPKS